MNIRYTLSFPAPHTHYLHVEMHISEMEASELTLKMAVWTPGSYLIREFQKNIDFVEAEIRNHPPRRVEKTDKNTWKIDTLNSKEITLRYQTYCFEYSVRTNFVDDSHALINGAPTFLYLEGYEDTAAEIHIMPFHEWKHISTALPSKDDNKWIRVAANLDELLDSPIEIGNHISYFFEAALVTHELAIYGNSNCDIEKLIADLKRIVEEETRIFGSHPCKNYVFIIHHTDGSYGGLEHAHSSVNHINRWDYNKENYQRAISLLAHEYFHLWNVKRIRPAALIPFNYEYENYSTLLWFFEGVTSYYDDYVCYRAGVTAQDDFFDIVAKNINDVLNTPGIETQTLAEASFDTWLKYYRRNENSRNSQISYYTKGAIIAQVFDIIIIEATRGTKSLDDVMRRLYENYTAYPSDGITEDSLTEVFKSVSGIDFKPFFDKYIHTVQTPDLEFYFNKIGLRLINTTDSNQVFLGLSTHWKEGKLLVTQLNKNYGAAQSGLNAEDEIIAIDGFRVFKDFKQIYAHKKPKDVIEMLISRKGELKLIAVSLSSDNRKLYKLEEQENILPQQAVLLNKWLSK
ncbi:MAG: M61 family metallopeptidase [Sphingobacteriales bacterium]|nr:M61 family metallopeptidase [Sphingobacteriales bacterium]